MKLSLALWLPSLACLSQAAKNTGHFFLFDSNTSPEHHAQSISPQAARLAISVRTGVDKFHDLGVVTHEDIDAVNALAYKPMSLQRGRADFHTALIFAYGKDTYEVARDFEWNHKAEYALSPLPTQQETSHLLVDLALQAAWMARSNGQFEGVDSVEKVKNALSKNESMEFAFGRIDHAASDSDLQALIQTRTAGGYDTLVLVMPQYTSLSSFTKGSKPEFSAYGSWSRPALSTNTHRNNKRDQFEEPLEMPPASPNKPTYEAAAPSSSATNSSIVRGILPQCFSSLSACKSLTKDCSGHGSCGLKYTDKDNQGAACYTCSCTSEVRTNADGTKKTTSWGGPACQKKDVVAPFWLLAGFSVFFVFLISWGIGTIMTMGNEELPSVIGAGVSGVPKR